MYREILQLKAQKHGTSDSTNDTIYCCSDWI